MSGGQGLFLDFDGTLVDSVSALKSAFESLKRDFGIDSAKAPFDEFNGVPLARIAETLRARFHISHTAAAIERAHRDLIEGIYATAAPQPGALSLVRAARAKGITVAIVTSGVREPVEAWLTGQGLRASIEIIIDGAQCTRGKPDPEPYLLALSQTGCVAASSLAVEDSAHGARSAMGAGLTTYFLGPRESALAGVIPVMGLSAVEAVL